MANNVTSPGTPSGTSVRRPSLPRRPAEGVTVLLVGTRPVVREGLGRCLRARGCDVVAESTPAEEGLRAALRLRPHVVVIDGGTRERHPFDFARALTTADRRQRVLLVHTHDDPNGSALTDEVVERAWDCGIHGIVEGSANADHLARAVDQVRLGRRHLPARPPVPASPVRGETPALTRRERQVLTQIAHGYSTEEAARQLVLSPATVKHHLSAAHRKLGARSRVEAVMFAVTQGIIHVDPANVNVRPPVTPTSRAG